MSDTSTIITRPLEDYMGQNNVSTLRPWIGTCYMNIPECLEIIYDLNNWQLVTALEKIDELIQRKPQLTVELWRLKVEIFGLYDKYEDLYNQCEVILNYLPDDPQALFLTSIYGQIKGIKVENNTKFKRLDQVHPELAYRLLNLKEFVETNSQRTDFEYELNDIQDIEFIGMFGYLVKADGSLAETTAKRASKALELAERYTDADVLISGGAVNSPYIEAMGIKNWLMERGLEEERIIIDPFAKDTVGNILAITEAIKQKNVTRAAVVSSLDHLPRCYIGTNLQLAHREVDCEVYGAAYEKPGSHPISSAESYRKYQTLLRSAGFFTKADFDKYHN